MRARARFAVRTGGFKQTSAPEARKKTRAYHSTGVCQRPPAKPEAWRRRSGSKPHRPSGTRSPPRLTLSPREKRAGREPERGASIPPSVLSVLHSARLCPSGDLLSFSSFSSSPLHCAFAALRLCVELCRREHRSAQLSINNLLTNHPGACMVLVVLEGRPLLNGPAGAVPAASFGGSRGVRLFDIRIRCLNLRAIRIMRVGFGGPRPLRRSLPPPVPGAHSSIPPETPR
jgi:hypothetical protein